MHVVAFFFIYSKSCKYLFCGYLHLFAPKTAYFPKILLYVFLEAICCLCYLCGLCCLCYFCVTPMLSRVCLCVASILPSCYCTFLLLHSALPCLFWSYACTLAVICLTRARVSARQCTCVLIYVCTAATQDRQFLKFEVVNNENP